jgi:hypothetical protein
MIEEITIVDKFLGQRPSTPAATSPACHRQAMAEGLKALGVEVHFALSASTVKTRYASCWGWRIGKELQERGKHVLVMERGYVGDRFRLTSLGWNGLNGFATFPEYPDDGGERFRAHGGKIEPWRPGGKYILILGQVPTDASLRGAKIDQDYLLWANRLSHIHGLPVYFRPHPDLAKRGINQTVPGTTLSMGTLREALEGALFTVCYNSNSAVDSVLAGVPCVTMDAGSMASKVTSSKLETLLLPDREPWAHALAWKQWSIEEIASGFPLEKLLAEAPGQ